MGNVKMAHEMKDNEFLYMTDFIFMNWLKLVSPNLGIQARKVHPVVL